MRDSVRAVIFDYFGTLTVQATAAARREAAVGVARALGVDHSLYFEQISTTFTERATGSCGDMATTMTWVAARCGHQPTPEQVEAACLERRAVETAFAKLLRPEAVPTLRSLRDAGLRLGVISDCAHELPECWLELPVAPLVETVVFSVEMGHRKPHPSLYQAACDGLSVSPAEALYVGDGGSNELSGAQAMGMMAVQLLTADATDGVVYDSEPDWEGPVIQSLGELVDLVDNAVATPRGSASP